MVQTRRVLAAGVGVGVPGAEREQAEAIFLAGTTHQNARALQ